MIKRYFPKGRKKKASLTEPLSAILPAVGRNLKLDRKVQEWSLLSLWEQVVDGPFKGKTQAIKLKSTGSRNLLLIRATSAAVASELSFYLELYQAKLNHYKPQTGLEVHQIKLYVG